MLKLIAWDDKAGPNDYMTTLLNSFEKDGFNVKLFSDPDAFLEQVVLAKEYDFIISDNILEDSPKQGDYRPLIDQILQVKPMDKPLVVVTTEPERLNDKIFPQNVVVKSKDLMRTVMKSEIIKFLIDRGVYVDKKKIFIIWGHDQEAAGFTPLIKKKLTDWGLRSEEITSQNITSELASGLIEKMNNCGAFIAVCTPDVHCKEDDKEFYIPRMNVILEIGIALGLSHGLNRLAIIQRWGAVAKRQAILPSDLGGVLSIRCPDDNIEHFDFDKLKNKLIQIGIDIT